MKLKQRQARAKAKARKNRIMRNPLGALQPEVVAILKQMNRQQQVQALKREINRRARAGQLPPGMDPTKTGRVSSVELKDGKITASIEMSKAELDALTPADLKFIESEVSRRVPEALTNANDSGTLPE